MNRQQTKILLQISDSFLENKKNELLLTLYTKDYQNSEHVFQDILQYLKTITKLDENREKLLNQIHTIIKKLSCDIPDKFCIQIKNDNRILKNYISSSIRYSKNNTQNIDFATWEKALGLNQIQKDLVYKTAMTFQLTIGCSNFCRRCNEWALPNVRSHFSFDAIQKILNFMEKQQNDEISLYGASDPLDWEEKKMGWSEKSKTIFDILKFLKNLKLQYSILTKVPKGKEVLLAKLIKFNANISVSITSKNRQRVSKIEQEIEQPLTRQHDLEELLIPARLDEDFISIKPSITDGYGTEITPHGAFIIIPTFTSALHPFGHKKIAITSKTDFFPIKITGRDALLIDYFKPLKGYNLKNKTLYLDHLFDVQVESIILDNGKEELTPPGMRSLKEYLEIFEEKPMLQRKKMTRIVLQRLKKQFLFNTNFKNLSIKTKQVYLKKIRSHLDLCNRDKCLAAKLLAVSFFLKSVSLYASVHSIKVKIMQFLLKKDLKTSAENITGMVHNKPFENLLNDADINSFYIFQYYIFKLLDNPKDEAIMKFIETYPSKYDPIADIFIQNQ